MIVAIDAHVAQSHNITVSLYDPEASRDPSGENDKNGWFTEGFDTRDLKEAKVLLKELAS